MRGGGGVSAPRGGLAGVSSSGIGVSGSSRSDPDLVVGRVAPFHTEAVDVHAVPFTRHLDF
eukprot:COSAG01_NODE_6688_length_3541_cov_3.735038_4_plen_61_part_00